MNSGELEAFSAWGAWASGTVNQAPMRPGVYAFRLARARRISRLKGESDLIYIGATRKGKRTLRDRLRQHLRPRRDMKDVGPRLAKVVREVGPLEVAWKVFEKHFDAEWQESELLARFAEDHLEFPPLNRQEPGKAVRELVTGLRALKPEKRAKVLAKVQEIIRQKTAAREQSQL